MFCPQMWVPPGARQVLVTYNDVCADVGYLTEVPKAQSVPNPRRQAASPGRSAKAVTTMKSQ